ncbi:hypothetical protein CKO25_10665 [Thiocapsa imhoffii]|uniref:Uncharacterized protein n=1 Tax=Thiocapsa imhoffii TaxID=382777 RepID=A0A9X0WID3_9GAMM|nr:hypothetical protein [Thiocapsa imhoffii]
MKPKLMGAACCWMLEGPAGHDRVAMIAGEARHRADHLVDLLLEHPEIEPLDHRRSTDLFGRADRDQAEPRLRARQRRLDVQPGAKARLVRKEMAHCRIGEGIAEVKTVNQTRSHVDTR